MAVNPDPTFRRRRRLALLGVVAAAIAVVLAGVLLYEHFHRSTAPAPVARTTVTVTIPEGYSRPQAAALVREDGLRGNYVRRASTPSTSILPTTVGWGPRTSRGSSFPTPSN